MENITGYLIRADKPYRGHTESIIYADSNGVERVAYTGRDRVVQFAGRSGEKVMQEATPDLTLAEYEAERGTSFKRITGEEPDALQAAHIASLITEPEPMSEDRYNELLECLPPCRWHKAGKWSVFHISERLQGNIVQWCAQSGSMVCYGWQDHADITTPDIIAKLQAAESKHY